MTTLKVGQRVSVYDIQSGCVGAHGTIQETRFVGDDLKRKYFAHDVLTVAIDAWKNDLTTTLNVLPQQCRRLKPKEKKKPREIWIPELKGVDTYYHKYFNSKESCERTCKDYSPASFSRAVKFVEVIEGGGK